MVVGLWMMIIGLKGGCLIQNEKKKTAANTSSKEKLSKFKMCKLPNA
jgi:hypothetical protein